MRRVLLPAALVLGVVAATGAPAAADETEAPSDRLADLALPAPLTDVVVDPELDDSGPQTVNIRLSEPAIAEVAAAGGDASAQQAQAAQIAGQQAEFVADLTAADPEAEQITALDTALNSVVVEADAETLRELADDPRVETIARVRNYERHLDETVPYIGASAVQESGLDGSGITVAVLDSGVDFTHAAFGGPGTVEFYEECYGTGPLPLGQPFDFAPEGACADFFGPGATVVGGFDFVGEEWPNGPRTEDPNPIDFEGHGTHVADIIGGDQGVAPGVDILAVKVCSAVGSSCEGVALIKAMDYVLDPNGDGVTDDAVDIVNMSLGANYGQAFDDDLAAATDNASAAGVLTVSSAGNGGDKPFVQGTPSSAATALSVAQTAVPSAGLQLIGDGEANYAGVFQSWSAPLTETVTGPAVYGDGAGGNLNGCAPFPAGTFSGEIVLVDRGVCGFSVKISNIAEGGGAAGIIGLVAPGLPFPGGLSDGEFFDQIPGYMISQADSNAIKASVPTTLTIDPANVSSTVGTVEGSSSRGPGMTDQILKPEIGAPGASVSAVAGSGDGTSAFGGTSGASPMVAGAAALVLQSRPDLEPLLVKAMLMNNAETDISNLAEVIGGGPAPISRIGAGEVRADAAVDATAVAFDPETGTAGLTFGTVEVASKITVDEDIKVTNLGDEPQTFEVSDSFRFADDEASGAVDVRSIDSIGLNPGETKTLTIRLTIDPKKLPAWTLNSGANGANGDALTAVEYDGYVTLTSATETLTIPWHILPRRAGELEERGDGVFENDEQVNTPAQVYTLLGTSPNQPEGGRGEQNPTPDLRAAGYTSEPVPAGVCSAEPSSVLLFAANTWEPQTHANAPASVVFLVDTDNDGVDDYQVFSRDLAGNLSDGRNVVNVVDLNAGGASVQFFTDHDTVSGNTVLTLCAEQLGLNGTDTATEITVTPSVFDLYFTGTFTDTMDPVTIAPFDLSARPTIGGQLYGLQVNPRDVVEVVPAEGTAGALLLVRDGAAGEEAFVIE